MKVKLFNAFASVMPLNLVCYTLYIYHCMWLVFFHIRQRRGIRNSGKGRGEGGGGGGGGSNMRGRGGDGNFRRPTGGTGLSAGNNGYVSRSVC